jgi:hypothetical protein
VTIARRATIVVCVLIALTALSLVEPPGHYGCVVSRIALLGARERLKDRTDAPRASDIDRAVTLDAMLAPGGDATRFRAAPAAEVEGWVVAVQVGGIEGQNCFALDAEHRDTHIDLALTPDAPHTARVVAEVTPRWRAAMRAAGIDWSTAALRAALVGRRVRVRGWLFFDGHHASGAVHTDPADTLGERNWRATAWEIHPVTAITRLP